MAGINISLLSAASAISDTDYWPVVQGGETKAATGAQIITYALPAGMMAPYAGATAPTGWLTCDGSAVSRSTYADLFTAIGETWGAGDSSTTFNVPDLREAAPVGIGTSGTTITSHDVYTLGEFKDDQSQDHTHASGFAGDGLTGRYGSQTGLASQSYLDHGATGGGTDGIKSSAPIEEGSAGTPRRGTVTRGKRIGVNYIIKT